MRRLIAQLVPPLSQLLAGPLADRVLEPAMGQGGRLVPVFGRLVGTGSGAGMALQIAGCGLLVTVSAGVAFLIPSIRSVEQVLPDHEGIAG